METRFSSSFDKRHIVSFKQSFGRATADMSFDIPLIARLTGYLITKKTACQQARLIRQQIRQF